MKKNVLILAMFLSVSLLAADYSDEVDKFFKLYASERYAEALESIYGTNKWIISSPDVVQNLQNQLTGAQRLVGRYYGKEFLGEVNVADRFVHLTYLALHDRQPLRFEFQFYKPDAEWKLYSFSFDDAIDDEIMEAAREAIAGGNP
jgi:hypothetical protein